MYIVMYCIRVFYLMTDCVYDSGYMRLVFYFRCVVEGIFSMIVYY